jgi:anaerobic selenocysteine-containing dehydrogenase
MVNKDDLSRLSIKDGERVQVIGEAGRLDEIEVVESDIKAGVVAMFYPESNVLIKANIDARSKTPAFKSAPVKLVKMSN